MPKPRTPSWSTLITSMTAAHRDFLRSNPLEVVDRMVACVDDGMKAIPTDSDYVTGSGSGQSSTERLAFRDDRAERDLAQLLRALSTASDQIALANQIMRGWPKQMPSRVIEHDAPDTECGICGRHIHGTANDRPRTIQAPTTDSSPRPIVACHTHYTSWKRLVTIRADAGEPVTVYTWAEWRDGVRSDLAPSD